MMNNFNISKSIKKNNSSAALSQALLGKTGTSMVQQNTKLMINNFPPSHSKETIMKFCSVFGKVKSLELLKDP